MFVAGRDAEHANFGVIPAKAGLGGKTGRRAKLIMLRRNCPTD